jgi:DNA-binding Lrp family transcriptional regulator
MISAVVLVNMDIGSSQNEVMESLKLVEGVEETHALSGIYDLIIKIKAMTINKIRDIIQLGIRQVAGVNSALTLMIV